MEANAGTSISVTLRRGIRRPNLKQHVGVVVEVKAQPEVEDFMREISGGAMSGVVAYGRYWIPLNDQSLAVYGVPSSLFVSPEGKFLKSSDGVPFTLHAPGTSLTLPREDGAHGDMPETLNLSYLRLVGISEGSGVTFGLKGVYSLDGLRAVRDQIAGCLYKFYTEYLRPVDMSIVVSTQEMQL